jgi:hypothetical protein
VTRSLAKCSKGRRSVMLRGEGSHLGQTDRRHAVFRAGCMGRRARRGELRLARRRGAGDAADSDQWCCVYRGGLDSHVRMGMAGPDEMGPELPCSFRVHAVEMDSALTFSGFFPLWAADPSRRCWNQSQGAL